MGLTEFGHFALISAFGLSLIQSVVPLIGTVRHNMQLMLVGPAAAISGPRRRHATAAFPKAKAGSPRPRPPPAKPPAIPMVGLPRPRLPPAIPPVKMTGPPHPWPRPVTASSRRRGGFTTTCRCRPRRGSPLRTCHSGRRRFCRRPGRRRRYRRNRRPRLRLEGRDRGRVRVVHRPDDQGARRLGSEHDPG